MALRRYRGRRYQERRAQEAKPAVGGSRRRERLSHSRDGADEASQAKESASADVRELEPAVERPELIVRTVTHASWAQMWERLMPEKPASRGYGRWNPLETKSRP